QYQQQEALSIAPDPWQIACPMPLSIASSSQDPLQHKTDLLAFVVREGKTPFEKLLDGVLAQVMKEEEFSGKDGPTLQLHTHGKLPAQRIALLGAGKGGDLDKLRNAGARAIKLAKAAGAKTLAIHWPAEASSEEAQAIAEGALMGSYAF